MSGISNIVMYAADYLEVQFESTVAVNSDLLDPTNYTLTPTSQAVNSVTVKDVVSGAERRPTNVFLVITPPTFDAEYTITVANIVSSDGSVFTGPLTATFTPSLTKLDNLLSTVPRLYDIRPKSNLRALFTAIGREDQRIGGEGVNDVILGPDAPPIEAVKDFQLIDTIEVVSSGAGTGQLNGPVTSVLFGATGDGFSKTPINGTDLDEYIIHGKINLVVSGTDVGYRINSDDTLADRYGIGVGAGDGQGSTVSSGQVQRMNLWDYGMTQPITASFRLSIWPEDGLERAMLSFSSGQEDGTPASINNQDFTFAVGFYTDTVTVFDSIQILAGTADSIGAGSYFRLYKLKGSLA